MGSVFRAVREPLAWAVLAVGGVVNAVILGLLVGAMLGLGKQAVHLLLQG